MINIYDNANTMAEALQQTQQYQDLKQAFDMLKLDAVGYGLFKQFQEKQLELQQQQSQGQDIDPDSLKKLQELGDKIKDIDAIKTLITKEQAMAQLMDELNAIVNKPISDLYRQNDK
ncbi:YlbF family regulator [Lacticaseibacillus zhaodongensis]|uniref:YlbF family regulator n=1 Tax=Lacticaseibacillus zhaodongensis TaxID=2668065 RepID=UPI0012D33E75|nr:YlbF family regulator [Lacticaseibacillus zhaodongensis]